MKEQLAEKHLHWTIQSGTPHENGTGQLRNYTEISVTGYFTPEEAIEAAKMIMPGKDIYHIARVFECATCRFQQEMLENMERGH